MTYQHNRGDTFSLAGEVTINVNGARQLDLTGWTGASQVRDGRNVLIADLTFEWADATQSLIAVSFAGSTADWPVSRLFMDIEFATPSGDIVSTQRTAFNVVQDVTNAA